MDTLPPPMQLYYLATGHYISHALYVVAKLRVADHLGDSPQDADALAQATRSHAPSLKRVLRLLITVGLFTEDDAGRFALTPTGAFLRSGPHSFAPMVELFAGPSVVPAWSDLLETVRTGEVAFDRVFGKGPFEYFAERPEEAAQFDRVMATFTASIANAVAKAYDFGPIERAIDLGGGEGALLAGILKHHPRLRGSVFDLPRAREGAEAFIRAAGLEDRYDFVGGDFFESVPRGYGVYMLKHVIHDWNDARATAILRSVRDAMAPDGKLLLIEGVYPEHVDTSIRSQGAARNDCNMLVATGGQQRSEAQLRALYAAAGFSLTRIVPTESAACVIEGVPV